MPVTLALGVIYGVAITGVMGDMEMFGAPINGLDFLCIRVYS